MSTRFRDEPEKLVQMPYDQSPLYVEPTQSEAMGHVIAGFRQHL